MSWLASSRRSAVFACLLFAACGSDPDVTGDGTGNLLGDAGNGGPADASTSFPDATIQTPTDGAVVTYNEGGCGSVRQQTEAKKAAVDVVWALDNSGSMGVHILNVNNNMNKFIMGATSAGADMSVTVLTAAAPTIFGGIQSPNFHPVDQDVQSHDAFNKLIENYAKYSGFLRPGAPTHIVVVTDDFPFMGSAEFLQKMEAKLGHKFIFHSVTWNPSLLAQLCIGAGDGAEYVNTAKATGGEQLPLCGDWGVAMQKLQSNVVASLPLPCDYDIPPPPMGQTLDPSAVQVIYTPAGGQEREFGLATSVDKCGDNVAWHFDDANAPAKIVMCPKACEVVKAGGGISIGFGCAPTMIF